MKLRVFGSYLSIGMAVLVAQTACTAQGPSVRGTWRLEETVTDGVSRIEPDGFFILGDTHYSVVLVEPTEPRRPLAPPATPGFPTDADRIRAANHWEPVIAHAGTYAVSGTTLTLTVQVSKNEDQTLEPIVVEMEFEGNNTLSVINSSTVSRRRFRRVE